MNEIFKWPGSTVAVQARLVPRFLWSTASIDVLLDNQCILQTGGQLKVTGSHSGTFIHSGSTHTADLSWGYGLLFSFPYQLRIDGTLVSEGRVRIQNWALGLLIPLVVAVVVLALFHYVRASPA